MTCDNQGQYPIDYSSDVGRFRVLAGDASGSPIGDDLASFQYWSDAEIAVYLEDSSSVYWAIAKAYLALASQAAIESKSVKDYDLQVNLTYRADDLREMARMWEQRAKGDDAEKGLSEVFTLIDTVPPAPCHPEAAPYRKDCLW